jgi:muconolactone D-isomerase
VEFLVQIQVNYPAVIATGQAEDLFRRERERGAELVLAGRIRRIWRVPGRQANVAIYEAESSNELHEALSSLPLFPWLDISVTALATHPLEESPPCAAERMADASAND